jgi:hypothetical protein
VAIGDELALLPPDIGIPQVFFEMVFPSPLEALPAGSRDMTEHLVGSLTSAADKEIVDVLRVEVLSLPKEKEKETKRFGSL